MEFHFPRGPHIRTLHPAQATRQGPLTAHPWSIPPGVWGPPRSGTPALPLHQPGPPPPGQPRLQAPKVELGSRKGWEGGGGEKTSGPTIPACPRAFACAGSLPAHPSLLPPGPRGKLPQAPGQASPLCEPSAPTLLFYFTWFNSSDTAVPWAPLCPSFQQAVPTPHTHTPNRRGLAGPDSPGSWRSSSSLTEHEQIEVPLCSPCLVLGPAGIEARVALLDPGKVEGPGSIQEAVAAHGGDLSRRGPRKLMGGGWSGHPLVPNSSEETEAQGSGQ